MRPNSIAKVLFFLSISLSLSSVIAGNGVVGDNSVGAETSTSHDSQAELIKAHNLYKERLEIEMEKSAIGGAEWVVGSGDTYHCRPWVRTMYWQKIFDKKWTAIAQASTDEVTFDYDSKSLLPDIFIYNHRQKIGHWKNTESNDRKDNEYQGYFLEFPTFQFNRVRVLDQGNRILFHNNRTIPFAAIECVRSTPYCQQD